MNAGQVGDWMIGGWKMKGRKKRRWMGNGWVDGWIRKGKMEGRKEDRRWIVE